MIAPWMVSIPQMAQWLRPLVVPQRVGGRPAPVAGRRRVRSRLHQHDQLAGRRPRLVQPPLRTPPRTLRNLLHVPRTFNVSEGKNAFLAFQKDSEESAILLTGPTLIGGFGSGPVRHYLAGG